MQTFLPYEDFCHSAMVLDNSRLGNQCYRECVTLIRGGWANHPASKMWQGHLFYLALYGLSLANEMRVRTKPDGSPKWGEEVCDRWCAFWREQVNLHPACEPPPWLGDAPFHLSHRSNLLRKMPEHYRRFWPAERDDLPYVWPDARKEE
jgi:hypothetical protein